MAGSDIPRVCRRWGSVAIVGDSMAPTYFSGEWLIVRWGGRYKAGEVVVVERESLPGVFLIKRIVRPQEKEFGVGGDNKNSNTNTQ